MARKAEVIYGADATVLLAETKKAAAAVTAAADEMARANGIVTGSADASAMAASKAATVHEKAASKIKSAYNSLASNIGLQLGVAGLVTAGVQATKMSIEFETAMERVRTQAGASQREVNAMGKALLDLKGVEQSPKELAEALYDLESVGVRSSRALAGLKAAAEGAAVGGASLTETTSALASTMVAYHINAGQAENTMAKLNATVGVGKMHMEDLVAALSSGILPTAKAAGLSLTSVGAALATMTDAGVPAEQAATKLRTAFFLMAAPTAKAQDALKKIHIGTEDMAKAMRKPEGIVKGLELLRSHLDGLSKVQKVQVLSDAFGGSRSAATLVTLVDNLDRVKKKYHDIEGGTAQFAKSIVAWHKTSAAQIGLAWHEIQNDMIKAGKVLQPVAREFAKGLALMANAIVKFAPEAKREFDKFAKGVKETLKGPVFDWMVHTTIAAVDGVLAAFRGLLTGADGIVKTIKGVLTLNFSEAWKGITTIFRGGIQTATGLFEAAVAPFKHIGESIVEGLVDGIKGGISKVASVAKEIAEAPKHAFEAVYGIINSPAPLAIKHGESIGEGIAKGIGNSTPLAHTAALKLTGSVSQQIVQFFEAKGFSHAAAAGISGNAGQESSYNPNAPGGGLFQTTGGRGVPQGSSVISQLESAYREMISRGEVGGLRNATDPRAAARSFEATFERAGIPALANRERYAVEAYGSTSGVAHAVTAHRKKAVHKAAVVHIPSAAEKQQMVEGWQEHDLTSYQNANAKIDLEVRAGVKTDAEGKAAKENNGRKALAGGYGSIGQTGILQVKGDLKELADATKEFSESTGNATAALEAHTAALHESAEALKQFAHIGEAIGVVEAGSFAKSLADTVSGQIAGVNYQGRRLTAGSGVAAAY